MNLFQMKSDLNGINRMAEFLKDNYVCFGLPGIGDLEHVSKEELKERLTQVCQLEEQELTVQWEAASTFAHIMQDGDYLFVANDDYVHLGDLGDYYYLEHFDTIEDNTCHRRGVTWLKSLLREELHPDLQSFLDKKATIAKFERDVSHEQLERWLEKPKENRQHSGHPVNIDSDTVEEAIEILKMAMRSEDAERRERAAIAILRYAK
ncbi:hypothetical protein [Paenibacillus sp. sgz302251]|uniref:hypothetical protein n=1 Tax=Paenibacillus sp. sgz302251 TaxID=3414493 RepID=UPI003C7B7A16